MRHRSRVETACGNAITEESSRDSFPRMNGPRALFVIARSDGPLNGSELEFLSVTYRSFGLDQAAWDSARGAAPRHPASDDGPDAYAILGVSRSATAEDIRATWKRLMRENHPDSLASRGIPAEFIASANDKVARINAAWDRIKRERGL